jgi:hypothetical protein
MKIGDLEGLAKEASKKARQVLWVPRIIPKKGVDENV